MPNAATDVVADREIRNALTAQGITGPAQLERLHFENRLRGATSPDGHHWIFLPDPLLSGEAAALLPVCVSSAFPPGVHRLCLRFNAGRAHRGRPLPAVGRTGLDSSNLAVYDPDSQRYVLYLRGHQDRQRVVRRAEAASFGPHSFDLPRPVFGTDPQDPIDDDVYSSGYTRVPATPAAGSAGGAGGGSSSSSSGAVAAPTRFHLMFPGIYHRGASTVDVQLCTSRDGELWCVWELLGHRAQVSLASPYVSSTARSPVPSA